MLGGRVFGYYVAVAEEVLMLRRAQFTGIGICLHKVAAKGILLCDCRESFFLL